MSESIEDILKGISDTLAALDRDQKLKIEADELKNAVGGDDDAPVLHITEREREGNARICVICGLDLSKYDGDDASRDTGRPKEVAKRFCNGNPLPGYDAK